MQTRRREAKIISDAIEQTRTSYEEIAGEYDKSSALFHAEIVYPKIIAALKDHFGSLRGKQILDFGCGSGNLLSSLTENGARPTGIDITHAFLKNARSQKLRVALASMHNLPFPDESFDGAVSNFALNYLSAKGQELTLVECFRVMRKNGVLIFTYTHPFFMRAGHNDYFHPKREETMRFFGRNFTLHLLDWPEIANAVIASGFRIEKLIDAEIPANLEAVAEQIDNGRVAEFVRNFRHNPYAAFIIARK